MRCMPSVLEDAGLVTRVPPIDSSPADTQRPPSAWRPKRVFLSFLKYRDRLKTRDRDSSGCDLGTLLEQTIADLENLNRSTERDFLAIGGKLAEFLSAARQLSSDMAALGELISGRSASRSSQVLDRVLERSRQAEARAEAGDRALAGVCASAREIGLTFHGFRDIVSVFRVLGSLTRIEIARLGAAGSEFGNLAEEVNVLTRSIESNGQGILDDASTLHRNMQSALAKIIGLRATELKEMPAIAAEVTTSLKSLDDRHRHAIEISHQQAVEYKEVSAAIEDLSTALQFHDITSQQIEHVASALKRLRAELPEAGRSRSDAPPNKPGVWKLQSSQLAHAEQIFGSSVRRIENDLDSLAGRVRNMAEAGKTLMGLSADEQDCFLLQMEDHFKAISKIAGTCAAAEAETQATLAELTGALVRMLESVSKIREIEICIRRIAINATIRAVQLGDAGAALHVIADVMQRLADDSKRITDKVDESLDTISDTANRLSDGSGWVRSSEPSEAGEVLADMRSAILELHSASASSFSCLNQITALSARLGDDIQSARAGFSAGTLLAEGVSRACQTLEEIAGRAGIASPGNRAVAEEGLLDDFAAHYTMQAERDIHEAVATGAAAPRPPAKNRDGGGAPAEGLKTRTDEEDFGDNVELF